MVRFSSVALLIALGAGALSVAPAPPAAAPKDAARPPQTWVLSDFDGDHRPEVAVGSAAGRGYTLEIQFSAGSRRVSFVLPATALGVHLFASDVDSDNDCDLVIAAGSFGQRAVWINDGKGRFLRGDRWSYAHLPTPDLRTSYTPLPDAAALLAVDLQDDEPAGSLPARATSTDEGPSRSIVVERASIGSRLRLLRLDSRGPPEASPPASV